MPKGKIFLIDGYAFLFRAYYASPHLISPDGVPIGGVSGFIQMIFKLIENRNIEHIAVILDKDSSKDTIRHKIFDNYKANRIALPQDLIVQFKIIREALQAFGIKYIEHSGIEADDIIASYVKFAKESGIAVEIVSSDKDLFQLIDETQQISMYDPVKDIEITHEIVQQRLGIFTTQLCDYLGLVGDTADNIPGVKGIGPKIAAILLKKYHSIERIYELIDEVEPQRIRNILKDNKEMAILSKKLVKLIEDLPLFYKFDELVWRGLIENSNSIQSFFDKYSLKMLTTRYMKKIIGQQISHTCYNKENLTAQYKIKRIYCEDKNRILSENEWGIIYEHIRYYGTVCVHATITQNMQIINIGFLCEDMFIFIKEIDFLKIDHLTVSNIKKIFESHTIKKIVFDLKKMLHALSIYEITINATDDIKLLAYATGSGKYDHKYDLINIKNEYLKLDQQHNINCNDEIIEYQESLQIVSSYKNLFHQLLSKLHNQKQLSLYYKIDKPLNEVLFSIEKIGVLIDQELLQNTKLSYIKKINRLEEEIYDVVGIKFNLHSPRQISKILFEYLKLPLPQNSKKLKNDNQYSTDNKILEELSAHGFSVVDKILEWRQYTKINGTFIDGLLKYVNSETRRIHSNFSATLTNSGRLSSSSPNLQNIPIRTQEGKKIRDAFISSSDHKLVSADYAQIEIRILAHIANITSLLNMIKNGEDIHKITAHQIFNIPLEHVNDQWRRYAKTINFGIIYGMSPFGLSKTLQIPVSAAAEYIKQYFTQYSGIEKYMNNSIKEARSNGYIKTLFGRRCFINSINSKNTLLRKFNERIAINSPIQGTAADIIRKAMVTLPKELRNYIILQIHDELLFEIPKDRVSHAIDVIKNVMESVTELLVPTPVEIKIGDSWGKMETISYKL